VAQTTWIVQADNSTAMPSLAAAVAAASDGDVIRILDSVVWVGGTLAITKSLRIVGDPVLGGSSVLFAYAQGALLVQLASTQSLTFSNLSFGYLPGYEVPVTVDHCAGPVTFQGVPSSIFSCRIDTCDQVLFSRVDCAARNPVRIHSSVVAFADCQVNGHRAVFETSTAASEAAVFTRSTVQFMNTVLRGGAADVRLSGSLPGARAATVTASAVTVSGASDFVHGHAPALPPIWASQSSFVLPSTLSLVIAGAATTSVFDLPTVDSANFASGQTATFDVRSPLGTLSALVFGAAGGRQPVTGVHGDLWIDPLVLCAPILAIQNGALAWQLAVPPVPALSGTACRWQAAALLGNGFVLGAPGSGYLR
jgi:hypothetical protein